MRRNWNLSLRTLAAAGSLLGCCGMAVAQGSQGSQSSQGGQSQPPAQSGDKPKTPDVTPLSLDNAPAPVNAASAADVTHCALADVTAPHPRLSHRQGSGLR